MFVFWNSQRMHLENKIGWGSWENAIIPSAKSTTFSGNKWAINARGGKVMN